MKQRLTRQDPGHRQSELFEAATDRPRWSDFPVDARAAVTELLARMLNQSRNQESVRPEQEEGNE